MLVISRLQRPLRRMPAGPVPFVPSVPSAYTRKRGFRTGRANQQPGIIREDIFHTIQFTATSITFSPPKEAGDVIFQPGLPSRVLATGLCKRRSRRS